MSTTYNALLSALTNNSETQDAANSYALADPVQETLIAPTTSTGNVIYLGNSGDFGDAMNELDAYNQKLDSAASGGDSSISNAGTLTSALSEAGTLANPLTTTIPTPSQLGANAAATAVTPSGIFGGLETWLTSSSSNIVAVLIGIVLIAGAIWSFSAVKDTVIDTARGAAELAAE